MSVTKWGPFRIYRPRFAPSTVDIHLWFMEDWPCGWEWGWPDAVVYRHPLVSLRIGKLEILSIEIGRKYLEVWLLGFWIVLGFCKNK